MRRRSWLSQRTRKGRPACRAFDCLTQCCHELLVIPAFTHLPRLRECRIRCHLCQPRQGRGPASVPGNGHGGSHYAWPVPVGSRSTMISAPVGDNTLSSSEGDGAPFATPCPAPPSCSSARFLPSP